ncbi:hypothetical protein HYPSUDRAFT_1100940 [Hypholoma sublateritium FD-334 SS-4]|uniref:ABC transporter domain-containing protein n=1 Tax=Hypholoma sublateritium (strain FD-334 SS-4) TaxID=945553 RepID=A0A0D2PCC0_HYPSF|nr:hypothetical protein HYPSUDRAFT_1100940 [Hypholoma sublateritium FD-334 SS-4]
MTLSQAQVVNRSLSSLKNIYRSEDLPVTAMDKGIIPYPHNTGEKPSKGMSFDLSSVTFLYPGTQKTSPSLNAVSLKIQAGQLVVIVGANGSGKSTLIRILSRLYDPSSGTVHIDGRPSAEYIVSDLHEATALLSQDSQLYPLSLRENIGLGYHAKVGDGSLVEQAAEQGGATEFISKLKDGMDTILEPMIKPFEMNLYNKKSHFLYKEMEALRKKIDISGGERQKVVAARSFMRFQSGKIKFVAVDEPSSALDAEAEHKLFENLIKVRDGKTLVFVTHRFGHLTKYADQIICMKDGAICESGSHDELMIKQGEYAKLYEIQASAFAQ